jgi:large repetitive protein
LRSGPWVRFAIWFGVAAVLTAAFAPSPSHAAGEPIIVSSAPSNGSAVQPPDEIKVTFDRCLSAPPVSSIALRNRLGTMLDGTTSFPACNVLAYTPAETMQDGGYNVFTHAVASGGAFMDPAVTFTVDGTGPVPPSVTIPSPVNDANRKLIAVTGFGEVGTRAAILIDDLNPGTPAVVCSVPGQPACPIVDFGGRFDSGPFNLSGLDDSPAPSTGPTTATITASVTLRDAAGNISAPGKASTVKDVIPPATPAITSPVNGQENANQRWTISGTATAETGRRSIEVRVYDGVTQKAVTRAFCSGASCAWSTTILFPPNSTHALAVRAADAAGNQSNASVTTNVVTDDNTGDGPIIPSIDPSLNPIREALSVSGVARSGAHLTISIAGGPFQPCATATTSIPNYACGPFDVSALPDGGVPVKVRDGGFLGGTGTVAVVKDSETPATPLIRFDVPGPRINAAQASSVRLFGSAEPGATASLAVSSSGGGPSIGALPVTDAFGNWQAVYDLTAMTDGTLTATAASVDARGNTSAAATAPTNPILDTTAPPAPVITSPLEGATITTQTVAVAGTTAGGSSLVEIAEASTLLASGTAASFAGAGLTVVLLGDGAHVIRARARDLAGNFGPYTVPARTIFVDADPPQLVSTTPLAGGAMAGSATVKATYTDPDHATLASCTLQVRDAIADLAAGAAMANGMDCTWTPAARALSELAGPYSATAQASDPAGNRSPRDQWSFDVDSVAPLAPFVSIPSEGAFLGSGSVTVEGSAEPGSTVKIFEGITLLGSQTANPFFAIPLTFAEGPHTLTVTAADAAGNVSPATTRSFTVDFTAPAAPVITNPSEGEVVPATFTLTGTAEALSTVRIFEGLTLRATVTASPSWSVLMSFSDGPHTITATATDRAGNTGPAATRSFVADVSAPAEPIITFPSEGQFLNTASITIQGSADAGSTVRVYEGTVLLGVTTPTPSWSLPQMFSENTHVIRATATDALGNVSTSALRTFTIDLHAPGPPLIMTPGSDAFVRNTFDVAGNAERLAQVQVFEGPAFLSSTFADANGAWRLTLTLADGPHTIRALQADPAGNVSGLSASVAITVGPPQPPMITNPGEGSTKPGSFVMTGSAEPNTTLSVYEGATLVGQVGVTPGGSWSLGVDLANGSHAVHGKIRDAAGNESIDSTLRNFTVDDIAPAVTVNTLPLPLIVAGAPLIEGAAADNRGVLRVRVRVLTLLGTEARPQTYATCSGCGFTSPPVSWSFKVTGLLPGIYAVEVRAEDAVGNLSPTASVTVISVL